MTTTTTKVVFSKALVAQTGRPGDVMASFLDHQIKAIQKDIEQKFSKPPQDAVTQILAAFVTLEGTKQPIAQAALYEKLTLEQSLVNVILQWLVKARILRQEDKIYEIAHDVLAIKIAEKRMSEEIELFKIEQLIKDRLAAFEALKTYLTKTELEYIAYNERRLRLTQAERDFLKKSKIRIQRKQNIRIAMMGGLFLMVVFLVWGGYQLKRAKERQHQQALKEAIKIDYKAAMQNIDDEQVRKELNAIWERALDLELTLQKQKIGNETAPDSTKIQTDHNNAQHRNKQTDTTTSKLDTVTKQVPQKVKTQSPPSKISSPKLTLPPNNKVYPKSQLKSITFNWTAVPKAIKYELLIEKCCGKDKWCASNLNKTLTTNSTAMTIPYAWGKKYRWKIRAIYANNQKGTYSQHRIFCLAKNTSTCQ